MPHPLSIHISNDRSELEGLLEGVAVYLEPYPLSSKTRSLVRLALEEMITNVIKYGYDSGTEGEIRVSVDVAANGVNISIEDDGREFNPLTCEIPPLDQDLTQRPLGGLGIHIVRNKVDDMSYHRRDRRNFLRMLICRR